MTVTRKTILVAAIVMTLPAIGYFGSKYLPCNVWKGIGIKPAWAVTCCCKTSGGGMCCADVPPGWICTGTMIPGCFCTG